MKTFEYVDGVIRNYGDSGFDGGSYLLKRIEAKANGQIKSGTREYFYEGINKLKKYKLINDKKAQALVKSYEKYRELLKNLSKEESLTLTDDCQFRAEQ